MPSQPTPPTSRAMKALLLLTIALTLACAAVAGATLAPGRGAVTAKGRTPVATPTLGPDDDFTYGPWIYKADCNQASPQSQRDRATYTDAELARYGLPPRRNFASQAAFEEVVRGATSQSCRGRVPYLHGKPLRNGGLNASGAHRAARALGTANAIWNGWIAKPTETMNLASSHWTIPCLRNPTAYLSSSTHWVGVGGFTGDNVIQVGTASRVDWAGRFIYQSWVENTGGGSPAGNGDEYDVDLGVSCGDRMYGQLSGTGMYLQDLSNGRYASYQFGPENKQNGWECMAERNGTKPLANFGTATFDDCSGYLPNEGAWYNMWTFLGTEEQMVATASGTAGSPALTSVGSPSYPNGAFSVTWLQGS